MIMSVSSFVSSECQRNTMCSSLCIDSNTKPISIYNGQVYMCTDKYRVIEW